jgi:hypothetical protein
MRCTAALLSRTYVFAAFDGRWPGVIFLILALSGKLALGPYSARYTWLELCKYDKHKATMLLRVREKRKRMTTNAPRIVSREVSDLFG